GGTTSQCPNGRSVQSASLAQPLPISQAGFGSMRGVRFSHVTTVARCVKPLSQRTWPVSTPLTITGIGLSHGYGFTPGSTELDSSHAVAVSPNPATRAALNPLSSL